MKILFMGTPEFAVASLKRLKEDGHEIVGVVAQADKPKGRGMKLMPPPVKTWALEAGVEVFQPETLRGGVLLPQLERLAPDLIAVVSYGRLLPSYVLDFPKYGCINVHGSLLPAYRGAAPIQRSVIDGQKTVGVSTMYMAQKLDAGDIILQYKTELGETETSGELYDRLMDAGAELLSKTIRLIENGEAPRIPQDETQATYAPILTKEEGRIDWSQPARTIVNKIRGLNPWPSAFCETDDGQKLKLHRAVMTDHLCPPDRAAGHVLGFEKNAGLLVACGEGVLAITELQAAGGRRLSAEDYVRGHGELLKAILR